MPTVEFNTTELIKKIGIKNNENFKNFSDEEIILFLKERIPMIGVDMENIDEEKIIVEIFPNRPDMLSVDGFARALKNFLNLSKEIKHYYVNDSNFEIYVDKSVENIRKYIVASVIKNLNLDEEKLKSLMNIQEKLHITHGRNRKKVAIGVHNFDVIKFPIYYKTANPDELKFIPLNFSKELSLREILKFHPKGIEFKNIIEKFDKYPVIIDSNTNVISMPPIINSDLTKVTKETKNLLIEITGTNFYAVNKALNIIVSDFADIGGEIYKVKIIL